MPNHKAHHPFRVFFATIIISAMVCNACLASTPEVIVVESVVLKIIIDASLNELPPDFQVALSYPFKDRDFCRQIIYPTHPGEESFSPVPIAKDYILTVRATGYASVSVIVDLSGEVRNVTVKIDDKNLRIIQ